MKKKIAILLIAGALSLSMVTGCSESKSEDTNKTETSVSVKKTQTAVSTEEKTIGEKTEGAYEIKLTNSTGQDITGVTIKTSNEESYPANMLKTDDSFAKDETRTLYYKPSETAAASTATETGKELPVEYTIQLTFADKSTLELHAFPFDGPEDAEILLQDKVAYITYEQDGKEVSTLEAEKAVKTQAEEAKKASEAAEAQAKEAEAAAAAEAQAASEAAAASAEPDTTYTESAETYTEPVQSTESAASTETDNSVASEGCVTDGLTY